MTVREASVLCGVPESTIVRRIVAGKRFKIYAEKRVHRIKGKRGKPFYWFIDKKKSKRGLVGIQKAGISKRN